MKTTIKQFEPLKGKNTAEYYFSNNYSHKENIAFLVLYLTHRVGILVHCSEVLTKAMDEIMGKIIETKDFLTYELKEDVFLMVRK